MNAGASPAARRLVVLHEDANMPQDALGLDIDAWLAHRFDLIDRGAPVHAIFWDIGFSEDTYAIYNHSRLLPPDRHPGVERWRKQGVNWVARLVESSHRRGIRALWNHRICPIDFGPAGSHDRSRTELNPLKAAHPDWVNPCWWPQGLWNLANAGLRRHKLDYFAELFDLHDLDGLQIDFARHTPCLPPGREWEHRDLVTEFLRQTRAVLQAAGQRRGRRLSLSVRVAENLPGNRADGFDVETWAREGLVDSFVLGGRTSLVDIEGFRRIVADKNIALYPCFDGHHTDDGYYFPPVEHFRGVFANWLAQGADAICLFNWTCAHEEVYDRLGVSGDMKCATQREALLELAGPDAMAGRPRRHAAERRGGYPWAGNYLYRNADKPLPLRPDPIRPAVVPIHILADPSPSSAPGKCELALVFWRCAPADIARIRVNGHVVEPADFDRAWRDGQLYCDRPQPNAGSWHSFPVTDEVFLRVRCPVPSAALARGENRIEVDFSPTPSPGATWEKAEITLSP